MNTDILYKASIPLVAFARRLGIIGGVYVTWYRSVALLLDLSETEHSNTRHTDKLFHISLSIDSRVIIAVHSDAMVTSG